MNSNPPFSMENSSNQPVLNNPTQRTIPQTLDSSSSFSTSNAPPVPSNTTVPSVVTPQHSTMLPSTIVNNSSTQNVNTVPNAPLLSSAPPFFPINKNRIVKKHQNSNFWTTLPDSIAKYFSQQPYGRVYNDMDTSDLVIQVFNTQQQLVVEYYVHELVLAVHSPFLHKKVEQGTTTEEKFQLLSLENTSQVKLSTKDGKSILSICNITNFRNVERIIKLMYAHPDCGQAMQEVSSFDDVMELNRLRKEWHLSPKYFLDILLLYLLWCKNQQNEKLFQIHSVIPMLTFIFEVEKEVHLPSDELDAESKATIIIHTSTLLEKLIILLEQYSQQIVQSRRLLLWNKIFVCLELLPWIKERRQTIPFSQQRNVFLLVLEWSKLFFSQPQNILGKEQKSREDLLVEFFDSIFENLYHVLSEKQLGLVFFKNLLQKLIHEEFSNKEQKNKFLEDCYQLLLQSMTVSSK